MRRNSIERENLMVLHTAGHAAGHATHGLPHAQSHSATAVGWETTSVTTTFHLHIKPATFTLNWPPDQTEVPWLSHSVQFE
jgi:hypothetical protein